MLFKRVLVFALLVLKFSLCFATIESGTYVVLNAAYGFVSNGSMSSFSDNHSYAFGIDFGHAFNRYLSIDVQTTYMPNSSPGTLYNNYFLSSVAFKGGVPIGDFFTAFIHLGPALLTTTRGSENQFGIFTGLGGTFKLSDQWGINVENYGILIPTNTASDVNIFAVGVMYGF